MMSFKAALVLFVAWFGVAQAYPSFWARTYAPTCTAVPTQGRACHKAPQEDKATSITVTDGAGKAVTTVCAGQTYTIAVSFPNDRYAFVTTNGGKVAVQNAVNQRCPNAMVFAKATGLDSPVKSVSGKATATGSGRWEISVASATGACAPFQITKASLPVGKC